MRIDSAMFTFNNFPLTNLKRKWLLSRILGAIFSQNLKNIDKQEIRKKKNQNQVKNPLNKKD